MVVSQELPKHYDFAEVEKRWQDTWKDEDNFFDPHSDAPRFVIDTPPPYPTGNFHIGNALNWCYIDFVARYRRMQGYNVMFPQGWDCHGLPTEVKVEEIHGITKNDLPREQFRQMCRDLTEKNIELMRLTLRRLGYSIDWSHEYITMRPEYYRKTQASFLRMLAKNYIYQTEHPVNYCTRCETAIAFAEVAYAPRNTTLSYFDFDGVEIATTRPELLAACTAVAVHPTDERYRDLFGKTLRVPFFCHEVPVLQDEAVDPAFGSGAVMICTFGDKQDVHWWKQHALPLRKAIDRTGRMTQIAGPYAGMTVKECRIRILADMKESGILKGQESLEQRVGVCWRCKTPIEILSERQWFIAIRPEEILQAAREICWTPDHMLTRLENWVESMEWDWCISRQRIFATPIPVWFCRHCNAMVVPNEERLPIDPTLEQPRDPCPNCGSLEFAGEEDVLDTWMDSSISVLNVTGWDGGPVAPPLFPAQLRPQGHDIIRTWAFYTILRSVALTGLRPWDAILVNGMVLGGDGFKMSKSRGNIIAPEEILEKYGSDAFRQWSALGAATGSDIMFIWNDVVAASRFQTKLWNITRFTLQQLAREWDRDAPVTALADRWLLVRLSNTVESVTLALDSYQFDLALRELRDFAWNVLADNYIELVKGRLYTEGEGRDSACQALYRTLDALYRMLAPFMPHFAEEGYQHLQDDDKKESVHAQSWVNLSFDDHDAAREGETLAKVVSEVRRFKHDRGMALNAPLGRVTVFASARIEDAGDASRALNADVQFRSGEPRLERVIGDIKFNMAVVGKALRKKAPAFMQAVRELPPENLSNPPGTIRLDEEDVPIPPDSFTQEFTYQVEGKRVDVITVDDLIVTVEMA